MLGGGAVAAIVVVAIVAGLMMKSGPPPIEEDDGRAVRGVVFVRCPGNQINEFSVTKPGHLLDYQSRSQRRVTRSTFTSELLAALDALVRSS